jgi:DNA repair protein RadC
MSIEELAKAIGAPIKYRSGLSLMPAKGGVRRWQRIGAEPVNAPTTGSLFGAAFEQKPQASAQETKPKVRPAAAVPPNGARLVVNRKALAESLHLRVLEERWIPTSRLKVQSAGDCAELFRWLTNADREKGYVVNLDSQGRVLSVSLIGVGGLSSAMMDPREVFKAAVLQGAAGVMVAHNHPSGEPTPSIDDANVDRKMARVGELLGVRYLGGVSVGEYGAGRTGG